MFQATDEEKLHPVQFVADKLKGFIKDQVEGYERQKAKADAEANYELTKQEIII